MVDETKPRGDVSARAFRDTSAPLRSAERAGFEDEPPFAPASGTPAPRASVEPPPIDGTPALGSMVDVTSLMILSATSAVPKSVRDLAVELNLPIASLYRRVRALQSAGVLGAQKRKDRATGKETMVYEGLVSGLRITFGSPDPVVEVAYRADPPRE